MAYQLVTSVWSHCDAHIDFALLASFWILVMVKAVHALRHYTAHKCLALMLNNIIVESV